MIVEQGHTYIGGANAPLVVSNARVVEWLLANGFSGVQGVSRKNFPLVSLPALPPGTDPDWDTVAVATRTSATGNVDVPSRVRWVVDVTLPQVAQALPPPPSFLPPPSPGVVAPGQAAPRVAPASVAALPPESYPIGDVAVAGAFLGLTAGVIALVVTGRIPR
jgi:hypothetical protein